MDGQIQWLFALLRAALYANHSVELPSVVIPDWSQLYRLAAKQGVLAIVWDGLQRVIAEGNLPPEQHPSRALKLQWAVNVEQIERRYEKQLRTLTHLAAFYHEHDIRLMLLKGYGLSLSYPIPKHRPCGDIDIWLYGEQARADKLLREAKGIVIDEDKHHHTVFTFEGVMVENHYDFLNVQSHRSNRIIEQRLLQLAYEPNEVVDLDGGLITIPSANFNALFLLRHAAAHFAAAEIGLRHVIDWAVFVARDGAKVDWVALETIAKTMNMHRFLHCLQVIVAENLGVVCANIPSIERDEALEQRVLNDIIHPEFAEQFIHRNIIEGWWVRLRRWWFNRWKRRLVYREGLVATFFVQLWSHLLKPKSFTH